MKTKITDSYRFDFLKKTVEHFIHFSYAPNGYMVTFSNEAQYQYNPKSRSTSLREAIDSLIIFYFGDESSLDDIDMPEENEALSSHIDFLEMILKTTTHTFSIRPVTSSEGSHQISNDLLVFHDHSRGGVTRGSSLEKLLTDMYLKNLTETIFNG